MSRHLYAFLALWLYRYIRFLVNAISSWSFTPIPLPGGPTIHPHDVTVIIPTICGQDTESLADTVRSCLVTGPSRIIIVTIDRDREVISSMAKSLGLVVEVFSIPYPNKRHQVSRAIHEVRTSITILADDDVVWPHTFLRYVLAPFEFSNVGAVGTRQRVRPCVRFSGSSPWKFLLKYTWEYLGACYIERRNFEITATSHIDGGISCLSGRTAAFRTEILKDELFITGYCNEMWRGKILNPDDDNFVTRWLVSHRWEIAIQSAEEAVVQTTLERDSKFLYQCLRWARSNWRSNFTSTVYERHVWRQQPWATYALHLATPMHSLLSDPLLFYLLCRATDSYDGVKRSHAIFMLVLWMLIAKMAKLFPHFYRRPRDIFLIPVTLTFGYMHGFIKYYALLTIGEPNSDILG
ncbi:glycosyltransferase family 2 protein [Melanomma pulvis-pyrius CBS 109.77]|uniref:Glycosyltransferase family 2 protein n=1 Tax=Melanomma pulvis-pyrius CBS 109.77 TaxID=1314802 RepID=A0A6A6WR44_9PLEO|nr:glycosyltransferase family 2 protein [Melanomma pulvis-pyrius CBS 109.77]